MFKEISTIKVNDGHVLLHSGKIMLLYELTLKNEKEPIMFFSEYNCADPNLHEYVGLVHRDGELYNAKYNGDEVACVNCDVNVNDYEILSTVYSFDVAYRDETTEEIILLHSSSYFEYTLGNYGLSIVTYRDTDNGIVITEHYVNFLEGSEKALAEVSELNLSNDEKDVINRFIENYDFDNKTKL